jgi:2-methylfumaryl-CoA hydratase
MVRKKDENSEAPTADVPELPKRVEPSHFADSTPEISISDYNNDLAGAPYRWGDYEVGEKIDHVDGMTIEEAEHQMATRLYQNTAKVHFNNHTESQGRFGKRLMYGGHVISMARALSFNGLANGFHVAAINGGRHVSPCFAGDTIYAWSEILEKEAIPGRDDVGALRVKTIAAKNHPCADFPGKTEDGYHESVMLDLDYWLVMPR